MISVEPYNGSQVRSPLNCAKRIPRSHLAGHSPWPLRMRGRLGRSCDIPRVTHLVSDIETEIETVSAFICIANMSKCLLFPGYSSDCPDWELAEERSNGTLVLSHDTTSSRKPSCNLSLGFGREDWFCARLSPHTYLSIIPQGSKLHAVPPVLEKDLVCTSQSISNIEFKETKCRHRCDCCSSFPSSFPFTLAGSHL